MAEQEVIETGAATEVAPVVPEATEEVKPVVPTEAPTVEETVVDAGDTAQQPQTKREVRAQLIEDRENRNREQASKESSDQRKEAAVAVEEAPTEAAEAGKADADSGTVTDVNGREHSTETGEFVAGEASTEGKAPAEEAAPAAPEAEGTRADLITVKIKSDHAVADMGQPEIQVATEAQAEVVRALQNGVYIRTGEVKKRDDQIAELRSKLAERDEKIVRRESQEAAAAKFQDLPAYQRHVEKYKEIHDMVDAESATAYWNSPDVQGELKVIEDQEFESRMAPLRLEADEADGQRWVDDALVAAQSTIPPEVLMLPEFRPVFDAATASFNAEFGSGMHKDLDTPEKAHKHFAEILRVAVVNQPEIKAFLKKRIDARNEKKAATKAADLASQERATAAKIESERAAAVSEARQEATDVRKDNPPHSSHGRSRRWRRRQTWDSARKSRGDRQPLPPIVRCAPPRSERRGYGPWRGGRCQSG